MAAVVFVPLFRRMGLGSILAYLCAGLIIGPYAFAFINDPKEILQFSELGVVFLLFVIGLELAPAKLWQLRRAIFGLGFLQVFVSGTVLAGTGLILGLSPAVAYIAGFGLALSSTAFSIQILEDNNQMNTSHGQDTFAILMFQDLAVVPLLASLAYFTNSDSTAFNLLAIIKMLVIVLLLIFVGHYVIRHVLRLIANSETPEVFTAMSLLIVVGSAVLMESVGLSMGMGAFLAGVLLANSEYRHELETNLAPFKGLLLGLFFMAVGMSLDLVVLSQKPHWILLITAGFMLVKGVIIFVTAKLFRRTSESARNISFNLALGGEFAFVLFSTALAKNLLDAETTSLLNASVTISMAVTPFLFTLNQRYLRRFSEISERPYDDIAPSNVEVIVAGFGRFGQIVSRFLNAEDVVYTILDHDAEQVDTARQFGNKVYYGDASRKDILEAAGAKKAKYFVLAIDDHEQSVEAARIVKEHFPHLDIIARVRNRQHAIDLMELGITSIHRETYMTSLEVAKEVMLKRGKPADAVERAVRNFRIHDEKILKKQLELRHDENQMVTYTSQATKELERILTEDRDSDSLDTIDAR
ncbi:MAG: cation:proton antiporter [Bdellovibrionaceae bacterium]|nr:cation:proton antiporter [Pseudobdellovibrionaceae bacterium]